MANFFSFLRGAERVGENLKDIRDIGLRSRLADNLKAFTGALMPHPGDVSHPVRTFSVFAKNPLKYLVPYMKLTAEERRALSVANNLNFLEYRMLPREIKELAESARVKLTPSLNAVERASYSVDDPKIFSLTSRLNPVDYVFNIQNKVSPREKLIYSVYRDLSQGKNVRMTPDIARLFRGVSSKAPAIITRNSPYGSVLVNDGKRIYSNLAEAHNISESTLDSLIKMPLPTENSWGLGEYALSGLGLMGGAYAGYKVLDNSKRKQELDKIKAQAELLKLKAEAEKRNKKIHTNPDKLKAITSAPPQQAIANNTALALPYKPMPVDGSSIDD